MDINNHTWFNKIIIITLTLTLTIIITAAIVLQDEKLKERKEYGEQKICGGRNKSMVTTPFYNLVS